MSCVEAKEISTGASVSRKSLGHVVGPISEYTWEWGDGVCNCLFIRSVPVDD